jgi:hypothetical protein
MLAALLPLLMQQRHHLQQQQQLLGPLPAAVRAVASGGAPLLLSSVSLLCRWLLPHGPAA